MNIPNTRLYAITCPPTHLPYETMIEEAILGGADIIQLRDTKHTDRELLAIIRKLIIITKKYDIPLIVNNRIDLALLGGADGVHLGQDDISIHDARKYAKPDFIIGISTHSIEQALTAEQEGADYIGIGPLFATPTKPTYTPIGIKEASQVFKHVKIPAFAIGGIDETNVTELINQGITRVAVVRAGCGQKNIREAVGKIKHLILTKPKI